MTSMLRSVVRSPRTNDVVQHGINLTAAVVFVIIYYAFSTFEMPPGQPEYTGPGWLAGLVAVAVGAPLAVRRRWPGRALLITVPALTVATLLHITLEPWIPAAAILYMIAVRAPWRHAVAALGATFLLSAVALFAAGSNDVVGGTIGVLMYVWFVNGGAWVTGVIVRERREAAAESRRRAAEQALADERLQIARELHDVVAHSMSLIAVQAGVANHVVTLRPEAARDALSVIESTSRNALTDIRRMLGVLRTPDASVSTPGLASLPSLVDQAVASGVRVSSDVRVDAAHYSDAIQLAAYRVVQEGLTNVVKHAGPTTCRVALSEDDGVLRIVVEDDGPEARRPEPEPGGHGLVGLRERAALYGGSLEAGPRGSGFRLAVTLPVAS